MKPNRYQFPCPACKTRLEVESSLQGLDQNCPACRTHLTVPQVPPRPIGGFLAFLAFCLILGAIGTGLMTAVHWLLSPAVGLVYSLLLLWSFILLYGLAKGRSWFRWAYPCSIAIGVLWNYLMTSGLDPSGATVRVVVGTAITLFLAFYFVLSKRVKETLIT